jgi:hypothetical protein
VTGGIVLLLIVGSIVGAISGNRPGTTPVAGQTHPAVPSASASPIPSPTASPSTTRTSVDPTFFKTTAAKQLGDYEKDLNDMSQAITDGSELRVASNSIELAFNNGEIGAINAPDPVASEWTAAQANLSTLTTQITSAAGNQDYTSLMTLIAQGHAQIATMNEIVNRA